jgi:hypothetical protein
MYGAALVGLFFVSLILLISAIKWTKKHESSKDAWDWGIFIVILISAFYGWVACSTPVGQSINSWVVSGMPGWFPQTAPELDAAKVFDAENKRKMTFDNPPPGTVWVIRPEGGSPQLVINNTFDVPPGPKYVEVYVRSETTELTSPFQVLVIPQ